MKGLSVAGKTGTAEYEVTEDGKIAGSTARGSSGSRRMTNRRSPWPY